MRVHYGKFRRSGYFFVVVFLLCAVGVGMTLLWGDAVKFKRSQHQIVTDLQVNHALHVEEFKKLRVVTAEATKAINALTQIAKDANNDRMDLRLKLRDTREAIGRIFNEFHNRGMSKASAKVFREVAAVVEIIEQRLEALEKFQLALAKRVKALEERKPAKVIYKTVKRRICKPRKKRRVKKISLGRCFAISGSVRECR